MLHLLTSFFFFLQMDMHPLRMGYQPRLAPINYRPVYHTIRIVHFPDAEVMWLAAVEILHPREGKQTYESCSIDRTSELMRR